MFVISFCDSRILQQFPWRKGVMYVLPRDGFVTSAATSIRNFIIHELQWANLNPVKPVAKIKPPT